MQIVLIAFLISAVICNPSSAQEPHATGTVTTRTASNKNAVVRFIISSLFGHRGEVVSLELLERSFYYPDATLYWNLCQFGSTNSPL